MAHDAELAQRVRQALGDREVSQVREIEMFGGLAFMVHDRMLVCVWAGGGDLLVRVSPISDRELLTAPGARRAEMGQGRSMGPGWVAVQTSGLSGEKDLCWWLEAALAFHAEGPQKQPTTKAEVT